MHHRFLTTLCTGLGLALFPALPWLPTAKA